ncbi:Glu-tRNA(Gln) amidotransferase subunit GatE [Candidatus Woesearchaeota archaeon]|nr:Glu-tRNA(Gln) amidotransferase subunit GatE [Candidatus Woesearchaeota archaeon]
MDYEQLGFKAGLEIHQQLDTQHKLFCKCPTMIRDDAPDIVVKRRLRASAGETGETDVAAAYEHQKSKYFIYHGYNEAVCAVELDEEPIGELNPEALQTCIQAALMLKAKPVDRAVIMRKTVVDGSNTSGFQRTAMVARNGAIELLSGKVGIATVCVEEESAKIVERKDNYDVYNLTRLGIPLIEIATEPDIKTPEQLKETAEYIGMALRSTRKVKRGLGTIRQDINVSIKDGTRVEIKGAQELRMLPKLAEYEALRQKNLAEISRELQKRKAEPEQKITDVTEIFKNTSANFIKSALEAGATVKAVKLRHFKEIAGREIQPGRRLGTEFSDYAKEYAKVTGIIHSDELPKYGITERETEAVREITGCGNMDAFAMVCAEKEKADKAMSTVIQRAKQAIKGVPKEVRKANADGTTTFLRPMPGSARMYPETDTTTVKPDSTGVTLPQLLTEKAADYEKSGLGKELARTLVKEGAELFFEEINEECPKINPAFIAETLVSYVKEMEKRKLDASKITEYHLKKVFSALNSEKIAKESVMDMLAQVADGKSIDIEKYATMGSEQLQKELSQIIAENKGLPLNALIGKAMQKLRGKAEGQKIVETLKKLYQEGIVTLTNDDFV